MSYLLPVQGISGFLSSDTGLWMALDSFVQRAEYNSWANKINAHEVPKLW